MTQNSPVPKLFLFILTIYTYPQHYLNDPQFIYAIHYKGREGETGQLTQN